MESRGARRPDAAGHGPGPADVAFERAWSRYRGSPPPEVKEDCLSEAMIALWKATPRLLSLPPDEALSYLVSCVQRAVVRVVRAETQIRQRIVSLQTLAEEGGGFDPPAAAETGEEALGHLSPVDQISRPDLAAAIAALPEKAREILDLAFRHELTDPEIAMLRGLTAAAAKKQRQRALATIRDQVATGA